MKGLKELKERLKNDRDFKNLFSGKIDVDEMAKLAKEHGYDVTVEEIQNDGSLSDDIMEAVSGGRSRNNNASQSLADIDSVGISLSDLATALQNGDNYDDYIKLGDGRYHKKIYNNR